MAYEPPPEGYIDLATLARLTGRNEGALRRLAGRGRLERARKAGGRWVVPDPRTGSDDEDRFPLRGFCEDGTEWWIAAFQAEPADRWRGWGDMGPRGIVAQLGADPSHADDYRWYVGLRPPGMAPTWVYFVNPAATQPLADGPEGCETMAGSYGGLVLGSNPSSVPNIICGHFCGYEFTSVSGGQHRRWTRKTLREDLIGTSI